MPFILSCIPQVNKYDGIDMKEAELLARKAQNKTTFPIVLNDEVLYHLNSFIAKPAGRLHLKACLKRMEQHKKNIKNEIKKQKLPEELMAIPVIETGYQNTGSGIWSRERSTEEALDYLKENYKMLKDWNLAILAYNLGESKVRLGVVETNSRDAWTLTQKGFERDEGYVSKVMAVIIIMKNPDVLN